MYLKNDLLFHEILHVYTDDNVHIGIIQPGKGNYKLTIMKPGRLPTHEWFPSYEEALSTIEQVINKKSHGGNRD